MESEKLLPCPMCAGEGEAVCLRIGEDAVASWVRCLSCGLRTAEIEDAYSDLPSAIAAWNTRAPADLRSALEAETDGLVEMLKAAQDWDGIAVFEHSPEEIGLEVMEHYQAVLAALAPTKGDVS